MISAPLVVISNGSSPSSGRISSSVASSDSGRGGSATAPWRAGPCSPWPRASRPRRPARSSRSPAAACGRGLALGQHELHRVRRRVRAAPAGHAERPGPSARGVARFSITISGATSVRAADGRARGVVLVRRARRSAALRASAAAAARSRADRGPGRRASELGVDAVALGGGQVDLDLARELVLAREQERAVRLGVAAGARVREPEVADGAALARIERAAGLERGDRQLRLVELEVDEAEVQPVRGIGRCALDELLVDRARLARTGCRGSRSARAARAPARSRDRSRGPSRNAALRLIELALLELLAAAHESLIECVAIARLVHHLVIEPQTRSTVEAAARRRRSP